MRARALLVAVLAVATTAGCASVPESSPVQILRQDPTASTAPPQPIDITDPSELVRAFLEASADSTDKHAAARRFVAPEAAGWDDAFETVVLDDGFSTVLARGPHEPDAVTIQIHGTQLGTLRADGSFEPGQAPFDRYVALVRRDGSWSIQGPQAGVVVPVAAFRTAYRPVQAWFLDDENGKLVPDLRYLPTRPPGKQPARMMEMVLGGPSAMLADAAVRILPAGAQLRANPVTTPDGAVVVDLTRTGELDERTRPLLAAQVVLALAEVNVPSVELLVDGVQLLPDRPALSRTDVVGHSADVQPPADAPSLVVSAGRVVQLTGPQPGSPLPGQAGNGSFDIESAATTADGQRLAVVARQNGRRKLLVGGADGNVSAVSLDRASMSRPTWMPGGTELWTVLDGTVVAKVSLLADGRSQTGQVNIEELPGRISSLRVSRDGSRVVAVVDGALYVAAVLRQGSDVTVGNVRRLRPALGEVIAADWKGADQIVAVKAPSTGSNALVVELSVDGLTMEDVPGGNLTAPLSAVAAAPGRPLVVADRNGLWSFSSGDQPRWRQVGGFGPDAVPFYPG